MFFNLRRQLAFIACLAAMTSLSCSLPVNESPPQPSEINAKLDGSQCLEEAMPVLDSFIKGNGSPNEIIGFWDCLGSAVTSFERFTRGRFEDRFTSRELANFVERNFLSGGKVISPSLLNEIFKVKQLFVGGERNSISRVEMRNLTRVFAELKKVSLDINPYMKVYNLSWKVSELQGLDQDMQFFEAANIQVQQSAKDISEIISRNGQAYELSSVVTLFTELSKFDTEAWDWIQDLEDAMPLVFQLKKALAGGKENEIEPQEWRRFALLGSRGYIQYLRYFYFLGNDQETTTTKELIYVTRSIDDLFSFLGDMVEGKSEKNLKRSELLGILQALAKFVPRLNMTDSLLVELMKVKSVFFGGRIDYFEKADFEKAREKLDAYRILAEQFISYSKIYTMTWKSDGLTEAQKLSRFREAEVSLLQFSEELSKNLESSYDLQDLLVLARELDAFFAEPDRSKQNLEQRANKYVPLIINVKNLIFSDQDSIVGGPRAPASNNRKAWRDFLGFSAEGFSKYLYYQYFLKDLKITTGAGLTHFQNLLNESIGFLDKILDRKTQNKNTILFSESTDFFNSLKKAELFPKEMTVANFDRVFKVVIQKILLTPERRLSGVKVNGITKETLSVVKNEFSIWSGVQSFFDWLYAGVPADLGRPRTQILSALGTSQAVGLAEMRMFYGSGLDVSFEKSGRLYMAKPGAYYLEKTSHFMNLVRAAVRIVIRGYAGSIQRVQRYEGLTEAELNTLFNDLKPLIYELRLLSPNDSKFASSRFRDGNLFNSNSDGNELLSFNEATHLVMMITSGLEIDSRFFNDIDQACRVDKSNQYRDEWTVDFRCLTPIYKAKAFEYLNSMPIMTHYLKHMSKEQFDDFYLNIMKSAGYVPESGNLIKLRDLSQFPHVVQYVEGIFQKFDANNDGVLDTPEAMKAFPTFRDILFQASGGKLKKEQELKGLFTWLLKKAKPPTGVVESLDFIAIWVPKGEKGWKVAADRQQLAKILGVIAEQTAQP